MILRRSADANRWEFFAAQKHFDVPIHGIFQPVLLWLEVPHELP